jgi:uncharacterized protein
MSAGFCTIFAGTQRVARVSGAFAASVARQILAADPGARVLVFDDETGRQVDVNSCDLNCRQSAESAAAKAPAVETRGRGRPKLGVVAREVTLAPSHWDWLNAQPGGASATLRKLVENALRANAESDRRRAAREAAGRFLSAIGGDLPGFEEASRALGAGDRTLFAEKAAAWPGDVVAYARWLAFGEGEA